MNQSEKMQRSFVDDRELEQVSGGVKAGDMAYIPEDSWVVISPEFDQTVYVMLHGAKSPMAKKEEEAHR